MTRRYHCPSCGHHWKASRTRGRPKTALYTAEGKTLHLDTWADLLDVSVTALRYHLAKGTPFPEVVAYYRSQEPEDPKSIRRIVTAGRKTWQY